MTEGAVGCPFGKSLLFSLLLCSAFCLFFAQIFFIIFISISGLFFSAKLPFVVVQKVAGRKWTAYGLSGQGRGWQGGGGELSVTRFPLE